MFRESEFHAPEAPSDRPHSYQAHTTAHEIGFLMSIGTFNEGVMLRMNRKTLIEKYLQASLSRKNWGLIDRERVLRYARELLEGMS